MNAPQDATVAPVRRRFAPRLARSWLGIGAWLLIAGLAVAGLLWLEALEDAAHDAELVLTRLEIQSARLHSWDRRLLLGQTGADELPTIAARADEIRREGDELLDVAGSDPAALKLVGAMARYGEAVRSELRLMAGGDVAAAKVVQRDQATTTYDELSAALPPAQSTARDRADTARQLVAAGSVATLLIALAVTALMVWALGRTRRTAELRSQARFRALVHNAAELVAIVDSERRIAYASPAAETLLGIDPAAALGTSFGAHTHAEDRPRAARVFDESLVRPRENLVASLRVGHADGTWRHVEMTVCNLLDDPGIAGLVLNVRDVTERKALEDELAHRAYHDPLTGLPNRALLVDRLGGALARGSRTGRQVAVLFIDLDEFKFVNDNLGHEAGDQLLVSIASRLRTSARPGDTVARLGGDEFIVLLEDITDQGDAIAVAERCIARLAAPVVLDGREVFIGASIGIAVGAAEDALPEHLLSQADIAMYTAKGRGRGQWVVFDETCRHETATLRQWSDSRPSVPTTNMSDGGEIDLEPGPEQDSLPDSEQRAA